MNKKHIVIVTRVMRGGGAERVIAQLANYFLSENIKCTIITTETDPVEYTLNENTDVVMIGHKSKNKLIDKFQCYFAIRKKIKEIGADVVLSMPEEIGIYLLIAMIGSGIPVVVSERNNPWVMPDVKITRFLRKIAYPFAAGLIFQTEMAKSYFPAGIQKKGIVIPNPVDSSRIPERFSGEREKIIVAAGRLHKQKNFRLLITAFGDFFKDHPDYKLVIYGEGALRRELEEQISNLCLQEAVLLPGRTNNLPEIMNSCAMFVLSSDYEGSPNVLIEAMCMGMPVISTDCPSGGPRELIINGENGLLVPVGNKQALVKAMDIMTDSYSAGKMAENAYMKRNILTGKEVFIKWREYLNKM